MFRVLSCNVRVSGAKDGDNSWEYRKGICAAVIRNQKADLFGVQEMTATQFSDLSKAMPEYGSYGISDDATNHSPVNCIFYNKERFERIFAGGYWLSETPHIPGTRSWDSAYVRLANWVRFIDKTNGKELRYVNTHLDNVSALAREKQAELINQDMNAYPADYAQILTGDMNEDFHHKGVKSFFAAGWQDTYLTKHGTATPGHTYHGYLGPDYVDRFDKMDWVFIHGGLRTLDAAVIKDTISGKYPSDHYFVSADLEWA